MELGREPRGQIAFLDTPGVHKATGALNKMMVQTAMHAASTTRFGITFRHCQVR